MAEHSAPEIKSTLRRLQCVVVTPEATIREGSADFVALPLFDGEIGIAPGHSPMIGRLGYGEMRIVEGGYTTRYYVDGGFVEVVNNVVSVLTNRAVPAEQLDAEVAATQLATAQARPSHTPELMAIRDRTVEQARAQLRVARHAAGNGAGRIDRGRLINAHTLSRKRKAGS